MTSNDATFWEIFRKTSKLSSHFKFVLSRWKSLQPTSRLCQLWMTSTYLSLSFEGSASFKGWFVVINWWYILKKNNRINYFSHRDDTNANMHTYPHITSFPHRRRQEKILQSLNMAWTNSKPRDTFCWIQWDVVKHNYAQRVGMQLSGLCIRFFSFC